ncbi:MAG: D-glycero-beta-D-manno-heptose-7-phosphate kinase [Desulfobacteraceae bacterium]|nr:D-glycero-beta-D-manno-heptose-7-phosphate kinase [Desulfobacteraceae bacterium]
MIPNISPSTFQNANILIIGDIILDHYIYGSVSRISPEAPVPVLLKESSAMGLGGAGNVAANIAGLGGKASLLSVSGDDSNHEALLNLLAGQPISASIIKDPSRSTTLKTRVMARQHQLVRIDEEQAHALPPEIENKVFEAFTGLCPTCQTVILSDYGKGVLNPELCQKIIKTCREQGKLVLVDPKGSQWGKYRFAHCLTPNFKEFSSVVGEIPNEDRFILEKAKALCQELEIENLLITRGSKGMVLVKRTGEPFSLKADAKEVFDVSGAGDTVIASLAVCISMGWDWESSVDFANKAAGIVVGKSGTKPVTILDIAEKLSDGNFAANKILSLESAIQKVDSWKAEDKRIGFTNGCFDILHSGHVHLLHASARLCDKLIVGLNTDESITGLKGPGRPILSQEDRSRLIAALGSVDLVVLFDEPTPLNLISALKPHILIKGQDYQKSQVVGADLVESWGGEVALIDLVENKSTTSIIEKIKNKG